MIEVADSHLEAVQHVLNHEKLTWHVVAETTVERTVVLSLGGKEVFRKVSIICVFPDLANWLFAGHKLASRGVGRDVVPSRATADRSRSGGTGAQEPHAPSCAGI